MRLPGPLVVARLVERPNRFVLVADAEAAYDEEEPVALPRGQVRAHLPNPGRLGEFRAPGARWVLRHTPGEARRTQWRAVMAWNRDRYVNVDTHLANALVAEGLRDGAFPHLAGWDARAEVRDGAHRFDFGLTRGSESMLLEVKSVSLVPERVALFPDAPTVRGASHLRALAERARRGQRAAVLFVVTRDDVDEVRANSGTDPGFALALRDAVDAGVDVRAWGTTLRGREWRLAGEVPVRVE